MPESDQQGTQKKSPFVCTRGRLLAEVGAPRQVQTRSRRGRVAAISGRAGFGVTSSSRWRPRTAAVDAALLATAGSGTVPAGVVPAGVAPAGVVPAGVVPAGVVPAGVVPAGVVPAGLDPLSGAAGGPGYAGAGAATGAVVGVTTRLCSNRAGRWDPARPTTCSWFPIGGNGRVAPRGGAAPVMWG